MQKLSFPIRCRPTLALGADSSGSVCFANDDEFIFKEPVGDLGLLDNFEGFKNNIDILLEKSRPEMIVCDKHPGFISSEYARELAGRFSCRLVKVQHHKAHVAAAAIEHGMKEYIGIACDGLGYGDDDKLWGGEVFEVKGSEFRRIGNLEEQPMIGGDSAAIYPEKMLFGILSRFMEIKELETFFDEDKTRLFSRQLEQDFNVFMTTSAGRVLDAVSFLLRVCRKRDYEGQPAIELERFAAGEPYLLEPVFSMEDRRQVLSTTELFSFLINNIHKDKKRLAATAQIYLAKGLFKIAQNKKMPVVFAGGVAYNKAISGFMKEKGVLVNNKIPPGDGGVCVGQAVIANI